MAKGQKRSNKEMKKPKADKNKKAAASPAAVVAAKKPAGTAPAK